MNLEHLEQVALWLEDGCPHVIFHMKESLSTYRPEVDVLTRAPHESQLEKLNTCGTICCIGGYAAQLAGIKPTTMDAPNWSNIRQTALEYLDLPWSRENFWVGHDLFDHNKAPRPCSPAQAARAVRNVMAGNPPW